MKTKKYRKKLQLNKKTVVDLNGTEMNGIQGGKEESWDTRCTSCLISGCGGSCPATICCPTQSCPSECTLDGHCC